MPSTWLPYVSQTTRMASCRCIAPFGVPVVPVAGVITIALLVYNLYEWLSNDTYGVNHKGSLVYMGAMYVLAVVIYVAARAIRRRQDIDLSLINKEIPVE